MLEWEDLTVGQKQAIKLISEKSFIKFVQIWFQLTQGQKFICNWHHLKMCDIAEQLVKRERGNTVLNIPPGGTKTEIWSIFFPAWTHIQNVAKSDRQRYLNLSYADTLVKRNSRRVRDMIKSKEWQELWPSEFLSDQAEEWQLGNDGKVNFELISKSTGGQVTGGRGGYPSDYFSGMVWMDDPDKPSDMFSEVKRSKNHTLVVDTIRSRRGDKSKDHPTPVGVIQQRTHLMDTSGFIKSGGMGLPFEFVEIPALINQDYIDALPEPHRTNCINDVCHTEQINGYWSFWPANEDIGQLMDLWEMNEYTFMSQYMQNPIALGGQIFNPEWWQFYDEKPHLYEYRFITADTAQKKGKHNDFTVFCEWGVYDGCVYLIDMHRAKYTAPELRESFRAFCLTAWGRNEDTSYGILRSINVEDKSSGTGLIQELQNELPLPVTALQRNIDKVQRAYDATPQVKLGKVILPSGKKWLPEFIAEHSGFTVDDTHKHDDMVDNTIDAVTIALLDAGPMVGMLLPNRLM